MGRVEFWEKKKNLDIYKLWYDTITIDTYILVTVWDVFVMLDPSYIVPITPLTR